MAKKDNLTLGMVTQCNIQIMYQSNVPLKPI